ncbi:FkbM family methyltransferase [Flavobacterium polysaccharolyticum]|uniref:FkbM family methyltransferase n=1 Tax=Flavobacterium polysaccharolyticum TaxID=3133148 RepID=A0ABU9NJF8_9FLAO
MLNRIKEFFRRKIYKRYNISFSKSGEDMQLKQLLNTRKKGVYVDVGCWDPVKASNTYYFHLRGWKGICIDPNPRMKELFAKKRKSDIFVNYAVGLGNEKLTYYMLEDEFSSMNTLDFSFIKNNNLEDKVVAKKEIITINLKSLLDKFIDDNQKIDFLDIDVEGYDLEVLKSNDWSKYRPKVILIESDRELKDSFSCEVTQYLISKNYSLVGKSLINYNLGNLFFTDNQQ